MLKFLTKFGHYDNSFASFVKFSIVFIKNLSASILRTFLSWGALSSLKHLKLPLVKIVGGIHKTYPDNLMITLKEGSAFTNKI